MKLPKPLTNKPFKYFLITAASLLLVYILLRMTFLPIDPVLHFLVSLADRYFYMAEEIANLLFKIHDTGVTIKDHEFIFESNIAYQEARNYFIESWPNFLLFKKWSALVLLLIWVPIVSIRKKLLFTLLFLLIHFFSVISGLYLIGVIAPWLYEIKPQFHLYSTLAGTLAMFSLLAFWIKSIKNEILLTLQKLKINFILSDRKINEILVLLFILVLLRSFIIPFFDFKSYSHFLLVMTQHIAYLFNYDGYINGVFLNGEGGSIHVTKGCLGIITMFVFASIVYLTRIKNNKVTWMFILSGLLFFVFINIIRMVAIFIIVQGENGVQKALVHHDIYNYIVYALILGLWIVWFEFFVGKKNSLSATHHELTSKSNEKRLDSAIEKLK